MLSDRLGWAASSVGGGMLWLAASVGAGGREPWDTAEYWTIYFPAALLLCGILGFAFAHRTWRWPLAVMLTQLPIMAVIDGEIGSLAPLGAFFLLILSVPGMLAAALGSAMRRWVAA